jgi:hypothetical protein
MYPCEVYSESPRVAFLSRWINRLMNDNGVEPAHYNFFFDPIGDVSRIRVRGFETPCGAMVIEKRINVMFPKLETLLVREPDLTITLRVGEIKNVN